MRSNSSGRRSRNRNNNNNRRGQNSRSQVFDSNGPDVRIRGTAHQVHEKYIALAKDASASGDLVLAQSYLQYAEHYQRIINSWDEQDNAQRTQQAQNNNNNAQNDDDDLGLPSSILSPGNSIDEMETA